MIRIRFQGSFRHETKLSVIFYSPSGGTGVLKHSEPKKSHHAINEDSPVIG